MVARTDLTVCGGDMSGVVTVTGSSEPLVRSVVYRVRRRVSETRPLLAWHLLPADGRLRLGDGRQVTVGVPVTVSSAVLTMTGLHACQWLSDLLLYMGPELDGRRRLCRVLCSGTTEFCAHMLCCTQRTVLWWLTTTQTSAWYRRVMRESLDEAAATHVARALHTDNNHPVAR